MGICGSTESTSRMGMMEIVPPWVYTTVPIPGCEQDSLNSYSDGFQVLSQYSVMRHRRGTFHTDCARWSRGFTSGKHVFEIVYPENSRGLIAGIGVGTKEAPLFAQGKIPLIGDNRFTWGIDLRRRKSFHRGEAVKPYPSFNVPLPDKIYMYLDADSGSLMFASDNDYYGCAISGINSGGAPLHPMISATTYGATLTMVYRGKGELGAPPNLSAPPPGPPMGVPAHLAPMVRPIAQTTTILQTTSTMEVPVPNEPVPNNPVPKVPVSEQFVAIPDSEKIAIGADTVEEKAGPLE
ncbi:hypothetical protein ScPMuIL_013208 [Solemya velum]